MPFPVTRKKNVLMNQMMSDEHTKLGSNPECLPSIFILLRTLSLTFVTFVSKRV